MDRRYKKTFLVAVLFLSSFLWSQKVLFHHMEKVVDNKDKVFYRLPDNFSEGMYLGELEVQGFNNDDVEVFSKVYAKAKEIGANAFKYSPILAVDGSVQKFDPWNYRLKLYYLPQNEIPATENAAIILGSSEGETKVVVNRKKIELPSRSYFILPLVQGEIFRIGSGKLLGSTVQLTGNSNQKAHHFQIGTSVVKGEGGFLNFKTGDVIMLERSYGDFLTLIYEQVQF